MASMPTNKTECFDQQGRPRVVITGMGAVTPVGNIVDSFWDAVVNGRHGIGLIDSEAYPGTRVRLAAQVKDFDPGNFLDRKEARRMDRYCHFAVAAAQEAIEMSKIDFSTMDPFDTGVIIGSGVGGLSTLQDQFEELLVGRGPDRISPLFIPMMISNLAAGHVSMIHHLKGANYCVTTACASGTHAIGEAFHKIKLGYLKAAVAGGAEAPITRIALAGFTNMKALNMTDDPNMGSLPFDARRGGFVMGEGAGIVFMETMEHALERGAHIYAEVSGYGATADAYHITSPDPEGKGAGMAMKLAMREGGISADEVDYINAHGTGTPLNDKYETLAVKFAMGEELARTVSISSTKSVTGHLLGAAGGVEAIAAILAIRDGVVPPTIGLSEPDPECDLNYTPNIAVKKNIRAAISNSLGFGGQNGSLLFRKVGQ